MGKQNHNIYKRNYCNRIGKVIILDDNNINSFRITDSVVWSLFYLIIHLFDFD